MCKKKNKSKQKVSSSDHKTKGKSETAVVKVMC